MSDLTNRLRLLSGYQIGVDLVDRLAYAERHQQMQREALDKAADRIDELEREVATLKANCKKDPASV